MRIDQYISLVNWGKEKSAYDRKMKKISSRKTRLLSRKQELEAVMFDQKKTILYIHRGNNIICLRDHHNITNVTCNIKTVDGKREQINAQFCNRCKKFFISQTSYERYRKKMNLIPVKFQFVDKNGRFSKFVNNSQECSPLFLAGYNVSKRNNLSVRERTDLLKFILNHEIMDKHEIIGYLQYFIALNRLKPNFSSAIQKWEDDLEFVEEYNMDEQPHIEVDEIRPYGSKA